MVTDTRSTDLRQVLPHWLFGIHIFEIRKFFIDRFKAFKVNATQDNTSELQVFYGTPRAAFRFQEKDNNGKIILPSLNFFIFDANRNLVKSRPVILTNEHTINEVDGTIEVMRAPMHFDVNLSFNLFCNNNRERDYIMTELFQSMPLGDMWLHWFPDITNHPDINMAIPLKLDETFSDETEIEGLDMKDTRDVIRTTFQMQMQAMVPMKIYKLPVVKRIKHVIDKIEYESTNSDDFIFRLNKLLKNGNIEYI